MTLEKLQALLEAGSITQEEFDEMAKNINTEPAADPEPVAAPETDDEKLERIIQSKVDREMAKERKERAAMIKKNADLEKQLERLKREKMTDEEEKQLEFEEQQKELEEQRKELRLEKNKMYAVKAMRKAGISDTDETMDLLDMLVVTCEDETDIDDRISILKAWYDKGVKSEVDKRFKDTGYTPKKSENLNNGVNPYTKEQWNFTAQNDLEYNNPELAAQLKAAAGVK